MAIPEARVAGAMKKLAHYKKDAPIFEKRKQIRVTDPVPIVEFETDLCDCSHNINSRKTRPQPCRRRFLVDGVQTAI